MDQSNEIRKQIERLRFVQGCLPQARLGGPVKEAADLLERIYSQPVELPEPVDDVRIHNGHEYLTTEACDDYYTADQLTKAVQEATARALEAAARECDARYMGDNNREDMEAKRCADAIRNLIGNVPLRGVK